MIGHAAVSGRPRRCKTGRSLTLTGRPIKRLGKQSVQTNSNVPPLATSTSLLPRPVSSHPPSITQINQKRCARDAPLAYLGLGRGRLAFPTASSNSPSITDAPTTRMGLNIVASWRSANAFRTLAESQEQSKIGAGAGFACRRCPSRGVVGK